MALAFSFLFVVVSTIIVTVIFVTGQRYFAEAAFAKAVKMDRANAEIKDIVTQLDKAASLVCYCQTGRVSASAAYLLWQFGYKVAVRRGGLRHLPTMGG